MSKNRKQRRSEKSLDRRHGINPAIQGIFNDALQHHQAGRLAEAEQLYRQILALDPHHTDSLHLLGVLAGQVGRYDFAVELIGQAIAVRGDDPLFHYNLANALRDQGKPDEAAAGYERALKFKPDLAEAHNNLGIIFQSQGRLDDAAAHFTRALASKPDYVDVFGNLCAVLIDQEKFGHAEKLYKHMLSLKPDDAGILNDLGCALQYQQKFYEAQACLERALALKPDLADAYNNMGSTLKAQGKLDEAIALYRKALALRPSGLIYSNILMAMIYAASIPPQELAATAREFGERIADPLRRQRPFVRDKDPERKLRIGYVSPDFRNHVVNYFFEPLLKLHDRQQFEVFAYYNAPLEDDVTARLKQEFDHWRNIKPLSDDAAADLIEADTIDILIDLAGHTTKNRLLVFARKPAPVQVTWLGFPATTGMDAMDYRITDSYAEPPGMTEHLNTEALWRLPGIFCCYQAHENSPDVVDNPPFEDNGYITFGCFNNFAKVTDPVLETWARILAQVPGSRLLLEISGIDNPEFCASAEVRLQRLGLPLDRVILEPRKRSNQFVLYNRIDIALDPFPCNGGTTSMDTMWMGAPFITLAGEHFVSRMGVTILTNAGMPELIAKNRDEYVSLAVNLALDKDRLRSLRQNLRQKVAASPLMNQPAFARNMEAA